MLWHELGCSYDVSVVGVAVGVRSDGAGGAGLHPACVSDVDAAGVWAFFFFFQAEDGIRDLIVTGVQTCASDLSGIIWRTARRTAGSPPDDPGSLVRVRA